MCGGMDWYLVTKTINGHRYRYRQKTWREGGRVRTKSEYIGPADEQPVSAPRKTKQPTEQVLATLLVPPDENDREWEHGWDEEVYDYVHANEAIDAIVRNLDVTLEEDGDGPRYSWDDDCVTLPPRTNFFGAWDESATETYYSTLLHELVHWTGHPRRLRRFSERGTRAEQTYAREELVAELGAVVLMKHFGLLPMGTGVHQKYFQGWLKRAGDKEVALRHAKRQAARAVQFILECGIISL